MKDSKYNLIIPIIGYINLYLTANDMRKAFDEYILESDSVPRQILLIAGENNIDITEDIINEFIEKNMKRNYGNLLYTEDYNKVENKYIKNSLRYWRLKELKQISRINNIEDIMNKFFRIRDKFNYPKDFPEIRTKYLLDIEMQSSIYVNNIELDAKTIISYIKREIEEFKNLQL